MNDDNYLMEYDPEYDKTEDELCGLETRLCGEVNSEDVERYFEITGEYPWW